MQLQVVWVECWWADVRSTWELKLWRCKASWTLLSASTDHANMEEAVGQLPHGRGMSASAQTAIQGVSASSLESSAMRVNSLSFIGLSALGMIVDAEYK